MSVILKPLFDVLTGDVAVMDNVLYNYLILLVVGEIAYQVAWNLVGDLYHMGAIGGRASGSIIHWGTRLITYVSCAYIIRGCIWINEFVLAVPHGVWWLLMGIVASIILTIIVVNVRDANRKNESNS